MDPLNVLPDFTIAPVGMISEQFLKMHISSFRAACEYIHQLPYGYNTDRDEPMGLFKESKGTCTTKHAVIATLAQELGNPIHKHIGIYAMTETLVTGTDAILEKYKLPYLPMVHCFLKFQTFRVDLTEGNLNGKNSSIEEFIYTVMVEPNISGRDEYLLYRKALQDHIVIRPEFERISIKTVLKAREEGLALLKINIGRNLN
jgi:hypothetical protein